MEHSETMIGGCDRCRGREDDPRLGDHLLVCDGCFREMAEGPEEPEEIPAAHQPLAARVRWMMPGVDTTSEGRFDRYEREVRA